MLFGIVCWGRCNYRRKRGCVLLSTTVGYQVSALLYIAGTLIDLLCEKQTQVWKSTRAGVFRFNHWGIQGTCRKKCVFISEASQKVWSNICTFFPPTQKITYHWKDHGTKRVEPKTTEKGLRAVALLSWFKVGLRDEFVFARPVLLSLRFSSFSSLNYLSFRGSCVRECALSKEMRFFIALSVASAPLTNRGH